MEYSKKAIRSLNKACYLASQGFKYIIEYDNEKQQFYWRFPENKEVQEALNTYNKDEQLHTYLKYFKKMRDEMKELKTTKQ